MSNPAKWALERAWKIANGDHPIDALARYIELHEKPPVDPLMIEAREAYATLMERMGSTGAARQIRKGNGDGRLEMAVAKEALKRGIEIGKGEA